jgi:hypothetical protein
MYISGKIGAPCLPTGGKNNTKFESKYDMKFVCYF